MIKVKVDGGEAEVSPSTVDKVKAAKRPDCCLMVIGTVRVLVYETADSLRARLKAAGWGAPVPVPDGAPAGNPEDGEGLAAGDGEGDGGQAEGLIPEV